MKDTLNIENQELDDLFEKYRTAPDSYVFVVLADACRKMGRLDEALEICEQGVTRHPEYASGFVVKGKCLYDRGEMNPAREAFERVLELDPSNLVALRFLGTIAAEDGHYDLARRYFGSILELDPDDQAIRKTLRVVAEQEQLEQGDDDAAAKRPPSSESPQTADPSAIDLEGGIETSDELATLTLADIFASQGYTDKARRIYREILKRNPENAAVREKMEALEGRGAETAAPRAESPPAAPAMGKPPPARRAEPDAGPGDNPETSASRGVADAEDGAGAAPKVIELAFEGAGEDARPKRPEAKRPEPKPARREHPPRRPAAPIGFTEIGADPPPPPTPPPAADAAAAPDGAEDDPVEAEDDARPKIDERGNLSHFRRWIRRLND